MYPFAFEYLRMFFLMFLDKQITSSFEIWRDKARFFACKKPTQGIPENKWATKTTFITFHDTGGLKKGIPIMGHNKPYNKGW